MTRLSASSFWALCAGLVALFAAMLLLGGPESPDKRLLFAAQADPLVPAARFLTDFGAWWAVLLAAAAGVAFLAWRGEWRRALALGILVVSQRFVVEAMKTAFDRARPDPAGHLVGVNSLSFPSGHSANAMAIGLGLALLLPLSPRARAAALAAGLLFALAIGGTRLILGVHWPSDVVGGWSLGALWTLLLVRLAGEPSPPEGHSSPS
jgi:undecaprenyl-diphosphatase